MVETDTSVFKISNKTGMPSLIISSHHMGGGANHCNCAHLTCQHTQKMLKDYNNVTKVKWVLQEQDANSKLIAYIPIMPNTKSKICLKIFTIFITCMFLSIGMYVHVRKGVSGGQRLLELELQVRVSHWVWGLGTQLGWSALYLWAIFPGPKF